MILRPLDPRCIGLQGVPGIAADNNAGRGAIVSFLLITRNICMIFSNRSRLNLPTSLLLLFWLILLHLPGDCQKIVREYSREEAELMADSLDSLYGYRKGLINEFSLSALVALSYYPELDSTKIDFKYKKIRTIMVARPKLHCLFFKKENRPYQIIINKSKTFRDSLFVNMSFNGKTGIMGHELAHIYDYSDRSVLGLIWFGIKYMLFSKREIERYTDRIAIERGLGWQLYDAYSYIHNNQQGLPEKYIKNKMEYYLKPREIIRETEKSMNLYGPD